jgi:cellulose synthase/poly-beta-1,6-N-acetylglucosamine synthase-like glycosyltransferase
MISVIIPNLHSPIIDQVIRSVEEQTLSYQDIEIIVVGQDQYGLVPHHVPFIVTQQPMAAAQARNLGAQQTHGEYILFLDADCIAAPSLMEHLLARHVEGHAVVGGSIELVPDNYWVMCDNLLSFTPFLSTAPPGPRRYLPSLNLSVARTLFTSLGGFNPHFPGAAGEDIDLSLRMRTCGYELYFEPRARVYHQPERATAGSVWRHLRNFGRVQSTLHRMYPEQAASRLRPYFRPLTGVILATAPLLALRDIVSIYQANPQMYCHWKLLPGMVWGKIGWYWGLVEGLLAHETTIYHSITHS